MCFLSAREATRTAISGDLFTKRGWQLQSNAESLGERLSGTMHSQAEIIRNAVLEADQCGWPAEPEPIRPSQL